MVTPFKILLCFILALVTTIAVRFALKDKREQWFSRSLPRSFLTMRGAFGYYLSLGYPVTWQGFVVLLLLLCLITLEVALVIKLL